MKLKKLASLIIIPVILGITCLFPIGQTFADDNICNNNHVSDEIKAAAGCPGYAPVKELPESTQDILNAVIGVAGTVSVVFIVVGGINYITAAGDTNKVKKAKDTILYACIGLIICALAFAIVNFVIISILKQ